MTNNPPRARRLIVRLALLFAVGQLMAVAGVLYALPAMRSTAVAPALILVLIAVDLAILSVFAGWIIRGSVSRPLERISADVQRIADGDYRHRLPDLQRPELAEIRDSVNRLAERLIADQALLAENVASLDRTNRELRAVRDHVVSAARLASVGTLAAGIAHEVGNPLGAITAFVDVAIGRVRQEGGDTEILESIKSEAKRIDRIVRGVLDYARPPDDASEPIPAAAVVRDVRDLLESQGKLTGVDSAWDVDAGEDRLVAEPHRLQQVLVNLLLNALHAVGEAQSPSISVRLGTEVGEITLLPERREDDPPGINYMHRRRRAQDEAGVGSVSASESVTVIEVSDNGPGIDEADLEHLFDPFFTTKEPGEGTGLGLSICARLVEGMGGRITAENGSAGGARFTVRLPALEGYGDADDPTLQDAETK